MIQRLLKRSVMGMGVVITALAVSPNLVHAEVINGEVIAVKDDGSSFSFKRSNPPQPFVTDEFDIVVLPDTQFEKISSLKELAVGDEVVVDAAKRKSGTWEADSVRILKVRLYDEALTPETQPE